MIAVSSGKLRNKKKLFWTDKKFVFFKQLKLRKMYGKISETNW